MEIYLTLSVLPMNSFWAWLGAVLLSMLGLFLVDVLLRHLLDGRVPNVWFGLVFALIAYATLFVLFSYLLGHPRGWFVTALTAVGFVVALPVGVTLAKHSDGPPIRSEAAIPGRVDLVLVSPGRRHLPALKPSLPPPDLAAWDIQYTVAVPAPGGKGLEILVNGTDSRARALRALRTGRKLEAGAQRIEWRPGAQRAVVLDVDQAPLAVHGSGPEPRPPAPGLQGEVGGNAPPGDPLIAVASSLGAPLFALLTDGGQQRLRDWADWAQGNGGEADTVDDLEGPTLLDAGLRLVAESRTTLADRQLAYAYRPLLFFDKREPYDWPVDVDATFAAEAVRMCKHGATGDECEDVKRASGLDQSFDYLQVDPGRFGPADLVRSPKTIGSAYYYRVVHGQEGSDTYIDYWWYLPYNPSLSSWMCSPGFSLPDFDCFDHESDWEGVTVEVHEPGEPPPFVFYAQHAKVVKLPWQELEQGWSGLEQSSQVDVGGAHHPLVFVAHASHASYRNPCSDLFCFEYGSVLPEGKHNGLGSWSGNDDTVCAGACLKPLPVTRAGEPATWNAFSGPWGTQTCILDGTFCDRGEAPHSPAFQWRYNHIGEERL